MAIPTISTAVISNETTVVVTFSVPVAIADLTGITVSNGENVAVTNSSVDGAALTLSTGTLAPGDTATVSFASDNTITAVTGGESLAETLLEALTNSIAVVLDSALQTSAQIHSAVAVLAKATKRACTDACG